MYCPYPLGNPDFNCLVTLLRIETLNSEVNRRKTKHLYRLTSSLEVSVVSGIVIHLSIVLLLIAMTNIAIWRNIF